MNVVVVGCGRVGAALALNLFRMGHEVTVVDANASTFANLHADFRGRTVTGDVLSQEVLQRTGLDTADAVAAVSSVDSLNAVIAHVARTVYKVPRVVVRNYDPARRPIYEAFGLQVVSSTSWGVERIEELLLHPGMQSVLSSGHGETHLFEIHIAPAQAGPTLAEVLPAGEAVAASLTRGGRAMLPTADTALQAGDVLLVSATTRGATQLQAVFGGRQEG